MNEELLHYIWKFQLFKNTNLYTTEEECLTIIKPGIHNHDSGPDFFNGQIRLNQTIWAGNIEIHTKSSDWWLHKHQLDEAYQKIILHVVWEDDRPVTQSNGTLVPTLVLKGLISKSIIDKHLELQTSINWIPCDKSISMVKSLTVEQMKNRCLIERLEQKTSRINQLLEINKNDWEKTFYQLLAKYLGFKTNATPFELLATSIDFQIIRKTRHDEEKLLALLLGQAGFLNDNLKDPFPKSLQEEYNFLKNKFKLKPIEKSLWKFMRMRPANFPTIRIAQFASLFTQHEHLFQKIIETTTIEEYIKMFGVTAHSYFDTHYQLDLPSKKNSKKRMGKNAINSILINVVIPSIFTYGKKLNDESYTSKAIQLLEKLPSETNHIIKGWKSLGVCSISAFDSQALIQLKNENCRFKKCLNCAIGNEILKS